jgi:Xaa-Pro aminopeptidase
MHPENLARFREYLRSQGVTAALLANPFTLTWLTGYAPPIQTGPSPFDGGPALAWMREGDLTLIVSEDEAPSAEASGATVRAYAGYTLGMPLDCTERQAAVLQEMLAPEANFRGRVVFEPDFLTAALTATAQAALPDALWQTLAPQAARLRAVKTAGEIAKIRAALRLCDLGQQDVREHLRPGLTELELWASLKARMEGAAGGRLPVMADLVAGPRTADMGGPPTAYALADGDAIICDLTPRLDGYWGDNCGTYFAGQPSPALQKIYATVSEVLLRLVAAVRPSQPACALDQMARDAIRAAGYEPFPHHTGHGLGVAYHEEPRLAPYNPMVLEAGMVIAVEPGIYVPGVGGVRLEHVLLVTADGAEVMTQHLPH